MKRSGLLAIAAALSLSTGVYAADNSFDRSVGDVLDAVDTLLGPTHNGPQPGFQQPGNNHHQPNPGFNHGGHNPPPPPMPHHPGYNDGHNNHPMPPPPPQPWNPGWNNHNPGNNYPPTPQEYYTSTGYRESCRTWTFTAQTPNTRTEDLIVEETGNNCYYTHDHFNHQSQVCRPTSKYHTRKITVNIGARYLEAWEQENLQVCLRDPFSAYLGTQGMAYNYMVTSQDTSGFFKKATTFNLTPGAKKPANPDGKELSVMSVGITTGGDVRLVLNDNRAAYFRGEKIDISVDGMNIPQIAPNMPVPDVLNSFVKINAQGSFDVAPAYDIKLMDQPKAGKYVITIKFSRRGPLSSGAEASTVETFELR